MLDRVAQVGEWGRPLPPGFAQGIAIQKSFGSICATVALVSVDQAGLHVHRLTVAVDCGPIVHRDTVLAQLEGGSLHGLSAALYGRLSVKDGQVVEGNFDTYPILRMAVAPEVVATIVEDSGHPVGGVGEGAVPPVAGAVANAIFRASGQRIRELPLSKHITVGVARPT